MSEDFLADFEIMEMGFFLSLPLSVFKEVSSIFYLPNY